MCADENKRSLVDGVDIVGHILYTPVKLAHKPDAKVLSLAPLGVDPNFQRKGTASSMFPQPRVLCRLPDFKAIWRDFCVVHYPRFRKCLRNY